MPTDTDARIVLESLVGQQIRTITGRPNSVLRIEGDSVVVATDRSPAGQPVPLEWVQKGIQRLLDEGEIEERHAFDGCERDRWLEPATRRISVRQRLA
jgi:hypothetical protein